MLTQNLTNLTYSHQKWELITPFKYFKEIKKLTLSNCPFTRWSRSTSRGSNQVIEVTLSLVAHASSHGETVRSEKMVSPPTSNKARCVRWLSTMQARVTSHPPRVRLKPAQYKCITGFWLLLTILEVVVANRPPRFLIDGQSEIVVRLKEGPDTPVGKYMPMQY